MSRESCTTITCISWVKQEHLLSGQKRPMDVAVLGLIQSKYAGTWKYRSEMLAAIQAKSSPLLQHAIIPQMSLPFTLCTLYIQDSPHQPPNPGAPGFTRPCAQQGGLDRERGSPMMATSVREMPTGYTSLSNSSSGSVDARALISRACGERGWWREEGNQSCMPRAPYVHQGISTSPASMHSINEHEQGPHCDLKKVANVEV